MYVRIVRIYVYLPQSDLGPRSDHHHHIVISSIFTCHPNGTEHALQHVHSHEIYINNIVRVVCIYMANISVTAINVYHFCVIRISKK